MLARVSTMGITRAARTAGGGADSSVIVGSISRRTGSLTDEPGGVDAASHQRRHHAGRLRWLDRRLYRDTDARVRLTAGVLYAIRNGGYSRHA